MKSNASDFQLCYFAALIEGLRIIDEKAATRGVKLSSDELVSALIRYVRKKGDQIVHACRVPIPLSAEPELDATPNPSPVLRKSYSIPGFYKSETILAAKAILAKGASIRTVCRLARLSKNTVIKIKRQLLADRIINCECGNPSGHRGWCAHRLMQSPKRQEFLRRWHPA